MTAVPLWYMEEFIAISIPFYKYGLALTPAWISNHIHYKVWDKITYPFINFNGVTVEVYEGISNFIPHLTGRLIKVKPC